MPSRPTAAVAPAPPAERANGDGLVGNKATARVLMVLSELAGGSESYGVTELSRELGMTKNMVYRALSTLLRHGYVVRDATGARYQLGPGVLRLAGAGLPDLNLPEFCAPFMRRMREISGETATLAVPSERNAVTVAGVRGRGVIARRVPLGRVMPLHISPASRAILASFPDHAIERYLQQPLERFSGLTLTTPERIWREVEAVRERGYATVFGDHWRGVNGVAFPLPASAEYPHGSITLGGPAERLTDDRLAAMLGELREVMDELARSSRLYPSEYSDVAG
jgi:DNA-binding IclR family transcriptional regulator